MDKSLPNELRRNLIMSLGTGLGQRVLSPLEVAEGFRDAKNMDFSLKEIAEIVNIDSSMVGRFLNLLQLSPEIRHLVGWRVSDSTIAFSTASHMTRLNVDEQQALTHEILRNRLTRLEVVHIIQLREDVHKELPICVKKVLELRPVIVQKHIFAGAVVNNKVLKFLEVSSQAQRDRLLVAAVQKSWSHNIKWSGRLGRRSYTLVGGQEFLEHMHSLKPDFEKAINQLLLDEIENDR